MYGTVSHDVWTCGRGNLCRRLKNYCDNIVLRDTNLELSNTWVSRKSVGERASSAAAENFAAVATAAELTSATAANLLP